MSTVPPAPSAAGDHATAAVPRHALPSAVDDRLYYAQVREDARLELEVLRPAAADSIVVVSSAGCTALSLVAAGAGRVVAVDLNRSQNHLVELKLAAAAALSRTVALAFLGAQEAAPRQRLDSYESLRSRLNPAACDYWDSHRPAIAQGLLNAGVTERFIRGIVNAMCLAVHSRSRVNRLLACPTLEAQRRFFNREWDTWRWRMFFRVLLNRLVFRRTYDPAFFRHVANPSFPEHFRRCADHALTQVPIQDNYFLHHMFAGIYPVDVPGGVPAYLTEEGARALGAAPRALSLVDGGLTDYLRTAPDACFTGFALSNVCEWLSPPGVEDLFAQVARTAAPGARVCFRNYVGWTEVPARWREVIVEDRGRGERLMALDRSVVNRRFAACMVRQTHA